MTAKMNYWVARDLIKSGDIVNVYRPSGFNLRTPLYAVISFFTGSPIYHNVVAMWMTTPAGAKKLMAVEANLFGGKRIVPLDIYSARKLEVMPLPDQFKFADMEPALLARIAQQSYSLLDFVSIGLREFFGFKRPKDFNGQVCSELCAEAWISAGFPMKSTLVSPGKLKGELMKYGVQPSIETV